ncbi:Phosphatidylinositol (PI) 3-kinase [Dispira simplex]|nr:Phosphatidylinositol (PI) 3-kinase [Dispira simplex]
MDYPNAINAQFKDFSYCLTREVDRFVSPSQCMFVMVELYADGYPLSVPFQTSYRPSKGNVWNEWVTLPVKYCDLPLTSQLVFNVWWLKAPQKVEILGGCTLSLFTRNHKLRQGRQKLTLWNDQMADPLSPSQTPGKTPERTEMDRLEKLIKKHENGDLPRLDWLDKLAFREVERIHQREAHRTSGTILYVDLPRFDFPLVYSETESSDPYLVTPLFPKVAFVHDPELHRENLAEAKNRRLIRNHRSGPLDRDLKPNAKIRDELNTILKYPSTKELSNEEKDILWNFRFYLSGDGKALTKFLRCVTWSDPVEAQQTVELLDQWAAIDVDDALELLGPSFTNKKVRGYAVNRLCRADDDELLLYLLQLVQALRFEGMVHSSVVDTNLPLPPVSPRTNQPGAAGTDEEVEPPLSNLADFLIERALQNLILGNYFHWYLMVECEDKKVGKMYAKIAFQFMTAMLSLPDGQARRDILRRQGELMATLSQLSLYLRQMKDARPQKITYLRNFIAAPKNRLAQFDPLPLPLDPTVQVMGIIPEKSTIFKSSMLPLSLTFRCVDGQEYCLMFKTGDDLRQDQLVIQIFTLMDRLLRKEKLDLKLTPYKVLATGVDQGLIQFIPSNALANILAEHNDSLLSYLQLHNPDPRSSLSTGVDATVMDTYVKSCAGYCVITYLLGVGDRHLDNLLLTTDGRLFHIDFGYILGRDPKPFPPPMKLCKEMVEGMGGANGSSYQRFKSYCFVSFSVLRKSANLILNLLALMVEANIPDIAIEPDQAVAKVQDKFRLDLSEEGATQYFHSLINESVGALFPQVIETIHRWAMYWKQ